MIDYIEYLNPPTKYSTGKLLRKKTKIFQEDLNAEKIQLDARKHNYIESLKTQGLCFEKVKLANFKTKNGLSYPGLIATEKIFANEPIIKLPTKLLLNTKIAFCSEIHKVFEQNPIFFSSTFTSLWEDHILWAFLIFEN